MKVLIIGAGNIGRRHLQGALRSSYVKNLTIYDLDKKALGMAREIEKPVNNCSIEYAETMPAGNFDLVIIATDANSRHYLTMQVKDRCKYIILEKFLFNVPKQYDIDFKNNEVYVNTYRRALPCYVKLKKEIQKNGTNFSYLYYYFKNNMLCNSIHFIDLLYWLCDADNLSFEIKLRKKYKAKRKGYYDSRGWIDFKVYKGPGVVGEGRLREHYDSVKHQFIINNYSINEAEKLVYKEKGGVLRKRNFDFKVPSEFTGQIIDNLVLTDKCLLTGYEESAYIHIQFLSALHEGGWRKCIT